MINSTFIISKEHVILYMFSILYPQFESMWVIYCLVFAIYYGRQPGLKSQPAQDFRPRTLHSATVGTRAFDAVKSSGDNP